MYVKMETIGSRRKDSKTEVGKDIMKNQKASWDAKSHETFINLCVDEKRARNRPNGVFSRHDWKILVENFSKETGKFCHRQQLKNHYDIMRKEWQLWEFLVGKETGLGWDTKKQTVTQASNGGRKRYRYLLKLLSSFIFTYNYNFFFLNNSNLLFRWNQELPNSKIKVWSIVFNWMNCLWM